MSISLSTRSNSAGSADVLVGFIEGIRSSCHRDVLQTQRGRSRQYLELLMELEIERYLS
jgi:hypothetical protein